MATQQRYSNQQLQDLWVRAGGSRTYAPMAAAIAQAESGGNPNAINRNSNGTVDRGLWQINSIHGSQSSFDPAANARGAVAISKGGTDWRPWCVAWSNGRCGGAFLGEGAPVLRYMPSDTLTGNVPSSTGGQTILSGAIPVPGLDSLLKAVGFDPEGEFRDRVVRPVGYLLLGFVGFMTMIIGLVLLLLSTRTAHRAGSLAVRAAVGGGQPDVIVNAPQGEPGPRGPMGPPSAPPAPPTPTIEPITEPIDLPPPPTSAPPPKKLPYKPQHEWFIQEGGWSTSRQTKKPTRRRLAVRGRDLIAPEELPPTRGYKGRHNKPPEG